MAQSSVQKEIDDLRRQLDHYNTQYYVHAISEITDEMYDQLMKKLEALETAHPELITPDSPTQRVGGAPIEGFVTVDHAVPMMSIDNTYEEAEVRAFDARVRKALGDEEITYVLEPKIDGNAVNLRYEEGKLVLAAQRGDGRRGDDITHNIRTMASVPLALHCKDFPEVLEVRGEIYMPDAEFQRINAERAKTGEPLFQNPRNSTAGTLRQLDPSIVATRKLRFVSHGLGEVRPMTETSYWQMLKKLKAWGLPVTEHSAQVITIDQVVEHITSFAELRPTLAYATDGMVIKVDSFDQRERLGVTSKAPRWVIAYKYAAEQMATKLKEVTWQVGKNGTLTPVANMEPVFIAGSTVQRASLHNLDQIRRLDLYEQDTIVIEKAGEVIPYVVKVDPSQRVKGAKPIEPPTVCPSCNSVVHHDPGTPYILCINPACPAQLKERLRWFCGRDQMDIDRLGEALINQLVDAGLLHTFADIFRLTTEQLEALDRMGKKSADRVIKAIEASRTRPLARLLAGLGIRHVGSRVARVLAERFLSLDSLKTVTQDELSQTDEIGPVIAESVHDYFHEPASLDAIEQLQSLGINPIQAPPAKAAGSRPFEGMSIVVTGSMVHFDRKSIEEKILSLGGKASGSVSKKTAFVVAGEEAGSKLAKARELGVEVIDEQEFIRRVEGASSAGSKSEPDSLFPS